MNVRLQQLLPLALLSLAGLTGCVIHVDDGGWWTTSWGDSDGPRVRGNGVPAEETRAVGTFGAIHARGSFDVEVTVRSAGPYELRLVGDENILPHVKTFIEDDTLRLEMESGRYSSEQPLHVELSVPDLRLFRLSGSGDIAVEGLDNGAFEARISGSGNMRVSGRTDKLKATISGSGDMRLYELEAREASASISGSGNIWTHATEVLEVHISGSGDVRYKGSPSTDASVSGSGSVRPAKD
jgi:hypothetical protein